jgi:hypothetical protein
MKSIQTSKINEINPGLESQIGIDKLLRSVPHNPLEGLSEVLRQRHSTEI